MREIYYVLGIGAKRVAPIMRNIRDVCQLSGTLFGDPHPIQHALKYFVAGVQHDALHSFAPNLPSARSPPDVTAPGGVFRFTRPHRLHSRYPATWSRSP